MLENNQILEDNGNAKKKSSCIKQLKFCLMKLNKPKGEANGKKR